MPEALRTTPRRLGWLRRPVWWLLLALATFGWSGWRAYDYRAAVREARAAGFGYRESPTPFTAIRADWHAAFRLATWLKDTQELHLPVGTDLAPFRPLLLRLDPTSLDAWESRNVDALCGLTRLRELNLSYSDVIDLAPLAGLAQLQELHLSHCTEVTSLAPLADLAHLQRLGLGDCTGVKDLAPLAGLTRLQWLWINPCMDVTDLAPLAGLAQLQGLSLVGCTGVTDLAPLAGLAQLQQLYLVGCTGVTDLASLAGLAQLQQLYLGGCTGVKDLAPLAGLTRLQTLTSSAARRCKTWTGSADSPGS
ncbi:MAG: hypothetical protein K8R23_10150 [Chthoniobacter sp.]|nr:hypothetical protein [Chthoniobacter sp.]